MERFFNLTKDKPLSKVCIARGHSDFKSVFNYIKHLPYGRTTNRSDYTLVLKEEKGTCSTKHAFLKAIAIENGFEDLKLYLGVFKMNADNTPKIASILETHQLTYIPEAHCYLKHDNLILDITFGSTNDITFIDTILHEEIIRPNQIGTYKVELHQAYLKSWIKSEKLSISFEKLWAIREACILAISE
nr:hypothetical protein [uncultured Psychroserpens sp.]